MVPIPPKSIAFLILLVTTITPVQAQKPAEATVLPLARAKNEDRSILANGGVEEATDDSPKAWTKGDKVAGVESRWARDAGHECKSSLCLKKTVARFFPIAQWSQTVDRKGDSPRLKVSAWIKADQATKGILDVQFLDGKGEWTHAWVAYIGPKGSGNLPISHDWKRYEGVVAIPPDTKQIRVAPQIYGPGTLWFDDLAAEYTDAPATDPT